MQDIICHGVPSPLVWKKYINFRSKLSGAELEDIAFRNKEQGWTNFSVVFKFKNHNNYREIFSRDIFMQGFLTNLCLRLSCYSCHSKSLERESDITLADFWGIENMVPDMFDNKGASLVFVNTEKGKKIFNEICMKMHFKDVNIDEAVKYNISAYQSCSMPKKRKKFMNEVLTRDFDKVIKKYTSKSILYRILLKIKRILKCIIKGSVNNVQQ